MLGKDSVPSGSASWSVLALEQSVNDKVMIMNQLMIEQPLSVM